MTKHRQLILQIVNQATDHPTADSIFKQAKEQEPNIVLATVYNNLNALEEQGQIRRITTHGEADRYDKVICRHDHLVCDRCGRISDIEVSDISELLKQQTGTDILYYELKAHYICSDCKEKEDA